VPVSLGIDGNRLNAKFPAGTLDANGDLASVGNQ
jgi:hypothetical protein